MIDNKTIDIGSLEGIFRALSMYPGSQEIYSHGAVLHLRRWRETALYDDGWEAPPKQVKPSLPVNWDCLNKASGGTGITRQYRTDPLPAVIRQRRSYVGVHLSGEHHESGTGYAGRIELYQGKISTTCAERFLFVRQTCRCCSIPTKSPFTVPGRNTGSA